MRKIIVSEFVTLDDVFEDPGGAEGFKYGGWNLKLSDAETGKFKYDELFNADALLLGRVTYEGFAKAWPTMPGTGDFGERMNSLPKYVVSKSSDNVELSWNNSHLITGDIAAEISKLKNRSGQDILVAGSGQLVRSLLELGLIDELRLMVHPVVLGTGKRLFDGAPKTDLKLIGTKRFSTGTIILTYEPIKKEA